jgi:hypothetical protein
VRDEEDDDARVLSLAGCILWSCPSMRDPRPAIGEVSACRRRGIKTGRRTEQITFLDIFNFESIASICLDTILIIDSNT